MIPAKTHFDHGLLLDAVHLRYSHGMKAPRDDRHPPSRVDALAVELQIVKEEFNKDHYGFLWRELEITAQQLYSVTVIKEATNGNGSDS